MTKHDDESVILQRAERLLNALYGEITIDGDQKDRPDAAFFCHHKQDTSGQLGLRCIGVEITYADKLAEQSRQYLNDKKIVKPEIAKRLKELQEKKSSIPVGPLRNVSVQTPFNYFYEGIKGKAEKYASYMESSKFDQLILLFTSQFMTVNDPNFGYLKRWTDHLLGRHLFPFSKVIFVCAWTGSAELIFDKAKPLKPKPARKKEREVGATISQSLPMPFGKANMGDMFTAAPIVPLGKLKRRFDNA